MTIPSSVALPAGGRIEFARIGRSVDVWCTDASGDVTASVRVSLERAHQLAHAAEVDR